MAVHIIAWIVIALIVFPVTGRVLMALGLFALFSRNNTNRPGY